MMKNDEKFHEWLTYEAQKRNWTAIDIFNRAELAGYNISLNTISRTMKGTRKAGPDTCIIIAHALGIPREKVFRARGWLLSEPVQTIETMQPHISEIIRLLEGIPSKYQEGSTHAVREVILSIKSVISHEESMTNQDKPPEPTDQEVMISNFSNKLEGLANMNKEELEKLIDTLSAVAEMAAK